MTAARQELFDVGWLAADMLTRFVSIQNSVRSWRVILFVHVDFAQHARDAQMIRECFDGLMTRGLVLRTPNTVYLENEVVRFSRDLSRSSWEQGHEPRPEWNRLGELNSSLRTLLSRALHDTATIETAFPIELESELKRRRTLDAEEQRNKDNARSRVDSVLK